MNVDKGRSWRVTVRILLILIFLIYPYIYTDFVSLNSLVVGISDPKRRVFLKGPQSSSWATFSEAVTATD